jgi:hypothetical protein
MEFSGKEILFQFRKKIAKANRKVENFDLNQKYNFFELSVIPVF